MNRTTYNRWHGSLAIAHRERPQRYRRDEPGVGRALSGVNSLDAVTKGKPVKPGNLRRSRFGKARPQR